MSKFKNISITKAANIYFDGQVTSRTITFEDGSSKTLGVMLPGEYEFGTAAPELMEITSGKLELLLPGETEWKSIAGPSSFEVGGNTKFQVRVESITDYICSYL